jgi:hypothetical protein
MNKTTIEKLWVDIIHSGNGEFEYKLLSKKSLPALSLGYNRRNQRSLILELPSGLNKVFYQFEKENIVLYYLMSEKLLCVVLKDDFFQDLFDDFILSLYTKIHEIASPNDYSEHFVKYCLKWSAFFENKLRNDLTKEQVKGLFGELFYLKNLILDSNSDIDEKLTSWKGPYQVSHDFVTDFIDYEIKTIDWLKNHIQISSEFQLESESGKNLELIVLFVELDLINGVSLKVLLNQIKILILERLGDLSILINGLSQLGLSFGHLEKYEMYRFVPKEKFHYDASNEDFPKLIRSNLAEEIFNVKYDIRLSHIKKHMVLNEKY